MSSVSRYGALRSSVMPLAGARAAPHPLTSTGWSARFRTGAVSVSGQFITGIACAGTSTRARVRSTRASGCYGRRCPLRSPRWSVPWHNQHRPRGAPEHTFAHRTLPETLPATPPVGSKDDEISFSCIRVQHDRGSGFAVLFDGPYRDALALGAFPQGRQYSEALALLP